MIIFLFLPWRAQGQSDGELEKIAAFLGASSEADISTDEFVRLQDALRHPIKINLLSKNRLVASGLFTPYQAASLLDYRQRFGEVLSYAELASVDGFGQQCVEVLKPFVSLDTGGHNGLSTSKNGKVYNELSLKGGYRYSTEEQDWHYGVKYGLDVGDTFKASLGVSRSRSAKTAVPSEYSASLSYDFQKIDARLILGDFNARFGQGLLAWNGMIINSLTGPSNFMKKSSGVTPVRSFTGSSANTGLASEFGFGPYVLTAAYSLSGMKLANVRRMGRLGAIGLTNVNDGHWKSSLDAAFCLKGVNLFGETVYNWNERTTEFVVGGDFSPKENLRVASLLSWNQGKQWQYALSGNISSITLSSDLLYYLVAKDARSSRSIQIKSQINWEWKALEHLIIMLRLSDRFRTWGLRHRAELRIDSSIPFDKWAIDTRVHILKSRSHSALGYLNASYRAQKLTVYSRLGFFFVDNWDDRIYAYEHDAPGSFNVPAYYGRGVWAASVLSWKLSRIVRVYARASYISYPFMPIEKKKPGRAELKLQTVFKF